MRRCIQNARWPVKRDPCLRLECPVCGDGAAGQLSPLVATVEESRDATRVVVAREDSLVCRPIGRLRWADTDHVGSGGGEVADGGRPDEAEADHSDVSGAADTHRADATAYRLAMRVLIIGASRGIGAGLVRGYLADGAEVHATVRDAGRPGELAGLVGRLELHRLDVRSDHEIESLAAALTGAELEVVIHNAGIYRGYPRAEIMAVNAEAPIRTVDALLRAPAIREGGVIAIMTSQLGARRGRTGSLGDYGDSKAALNDEFRRRAPEWRSLGARAIVVHPGWVRTDMGGPAAAISVEESVDGIRALIAGLGEEGHGRFWTWDGREHPW